MLPSTEMSPYWSGKSAFSSGLSLRSWIENAMSSAVKSSPSDHFTPSRAVMTASVESAFHSTDSASHGVGGSVGLTSLTCMSDS